MGRRRWLGAFAADELIITRQLGESRDFGWVHITGSLSISVSITPSSVLRLSYYERMW